MSKAIEEAKDSMWGLFEGTRYELDEIFEPVERENENMRATLLRMHRLLSEKCEEPHEPWHGKPCDSCAENGSSDCPKIIARQMRRFGIEVDG